jgi:hypothetical protein
LISTNLKEMPNGFFRKKKIPLQTFMCFCESLDQIDGISNIKSLKHFELWDVKTNASLLGIYNLVGLKHLGIKGTKTAIIDTQILRLTQLEVLELEYNKYLKGFPNEVFCLKSLKKITLIDNRKLKKTQSRINKSIVRGKENCMKKWRFMDRSKLIYIN